MAWAESSGCRFRYKARLVVSVLMITGLTIIGCTPPTQGKVPATTT